MVGVVDYGNSTSDQYRQWRSGLGPGQDFSDIYAFKTVLDWQVDSSIILHLGAQFETGATPIRTFEPG